MTSSMRTALLLLGLFVSATAQAPIPAALREARTVYLVNGAGDGRALDELAKHLRAWKIITLVDAESKADVIVRLDASNAGTDVVVPIGGIFVASSTSAWQLTVRAPGHEQPIYVDREEIGEFSRYGGLRKLVARWRTRAESRP